MSDGTVAKSPNLAGLATDLDNVFDFKLAFEKLNLKIDSVIAGQVGLDNKIDCVIERVNTNTDSIEEMKGALTFESKRITDLERLQSKHDDLLVKHDKTTETLSALLHTSRVEQNRQERHSRSFNVRFLGIAEKKDENCRDIIEQLLQRKFGTVGGAIENAHRSGMQGGNQARQVIARFYSRATRLDVMRAARRTLEGTGIRIVDDLTTADLKEKQRVQPYMNWLYSDNRRPAFRNGRLYANKRMISLDEIETFLGSEAGKAASREYLARGKT